MRSANFIEIESDPNRDPGSRRRGSLIVQKVDQFIANPGLDRGTKYLALQPSLEMTQYSRQVLALIACRSGYFTSIYPAGENSTSLMGARRVRRHPHRRN
jgi:hypothetical protein